MKIYIGFDDREPEATFAAIRSLRKVTDIKPEVLRVPKLQSQGLLTRTIDHRVYQDYDLVSNAHQSTRFAISRFLVPLLCQSQWALFVDADVIFQRDPHEMILEVNAKHALNVVPHEYVPKLGVKMDGQKQEAYPRKAQSSVMLFNCKHPANERLSVRDINERPGRDLHRFYWLADEEIGQLDPKWNWLVGVQEKPKDVGIAHFTLGGPFTKDWKGAPHDRIWHEGAR